MTGWAFRTSKSDPRYADKWYPGNAYVDEIGADPYNWYDCQEDDYPWRDAEFSLDPIRLFAKRHPHKELMLAEYATVEDRDDPGRKAKWLTDMTTLLKQPGWEQFHTILYYHSIGTSRAQLRLELRYVGASRERAGGDGRRSLLRGRRVGRGHQGLAEGALGDRGAGASAPAPLLVRARPSGPPGRG